MITIVWKNTQQKAAGMMALADQARAIHVPEWARKVSLAGQLSMNESVFNGGQNKTRKGGPRILSGAMLESISGQVSHFGADATATAGFGVNESTPKWTKWQEGGTPPRAGNRGIPAMMAIPLAAMAMETEMDNAGMQMLSRIRKGWNAI